MMISKIRTKLNNLTPGMTFKKYTKQVLYNGQDCGYIELAGKKKFILSPTIEKLERKLELNDFHPAQPKNIDLKDFEIFKNLLRPFIRNEKGIKKLGTNMDLYYSPSPASIQVYDKKRREPVILIIKKLKSPTKEIFYNAFPIFRKLFRVMPK